MAERTLPIPLPRASGRAGRALHLELREPTAAEFFDGAPDFYPGTECFAKAGAEGQRANLVEQAAWIEQLIDRCSRPGTASALGADHDHVVTFLATRWRWSSLDGTELGPAWAMPGPNTRTILRRLSERTGRLPSELMRMPISDVMFDYRIFFERDAKVLGRRRGHLRVVGAMNDASLPAEMPGGPEPDGDG